MIRTSRRAFGLSGIAMLAAVRAGAGGAQAAGFQVALSDADWRRRLTPAQYTVLRQMGTERPYSSGLNAEHRAGTFACAGCATPVFSSTTKYDSHTGWPSFWQALPGGTGTQEDASFGTVRTAVHCANCGGHLGHVFKDGPAPTGQRWCMNGVAMRFQAGAA